MIEQRDFVTGGWSDYFTQLQTFFRDSTRETGIAIARLLYAPVRYIWRDSNLVMLYTLHAYLQEEGDFITEC